MHYLVVGPERVELVELRLHQLLDRSLIAHNETLLSKVVLGVLKQLSESDAQSPGVGFKGLEALNQDARNLLLDTLLDIPEQVDDHP